MGHRNRRASSRRGAYGMESIAWKHPETQRSFQRYRRHAWAWLGSGAAGTVGSLWIGLVADNSGMKWLGSTMAGVWVLFVGVSLFGICMAYNAARMRSQLRRYPWKPYPVTVLPPWLGGPVVQLRPTGSESVYIQSVVSLNLRWHHVQGNNTLWFCGIPGRGGVLARPGGEPLLWGRRVRIPWLRHWHERASA